MPIVKRPSMAVPGAAPDTEPAAHIAALNSPEVETRWNAARALAGRPEAVPALAAALASEPTARVREAIMTALVRVGNEASVRALLPSLRSDDAAARGAAIDALQALPQAVAPFLTALLADTDADVRILATELARNMPAGEATRLLAGLIEHEAHPNVCAAAVDVLAELGTTDALPALRKCADRFSATPFLPFAVSVAIARISGSES